MKAPTLLWLLPFLFQISCAGTDNMAYVEEIKDEYYKLHWDPLMKEMEKAPDARKFERRPLKTKTCRKSMMSSLPEECEEYRKKRPRKRRGGRYSFNR